MNLVLKQTVFTSVLVLGGLTSICHAQTPALDGFNPEFVLSSSVAWVYSAFQQHDQKIVVGGEFAGVVGASTGGLARFNPDGSPDAGFDPKVLNDVYAVAIQTDARILIAGDFKKINGNWRTNIARLDFNGVLEPSYNPGSVGFVQDVIYSLALQPDAKVLVAGPLSILGGQTRLGIGRLNSSGALDANFNPSVMFPFSMTLQTDGGILVGGAFKSISGYPRASIGRLDTLGAVDLNFDPGQTNTPNLIGAITEQADGRILVGGRFNTFAGAPRTNIARVYSDGSIDPFFHPEVVGAIRSMAIQADGKILIAGTIHSVDGQLRNGLARLNPDGSLDDAFNPASINTDAGVNSVSIQTDGKILIGGTFTRVGAEPRTNIARLNATGPATQSLDFANNVITWLRGGTSPEVWRTTFEHTADSLTWTNLGAGSRIPGGWALTNLSLTIGVIRARGFVAGGQYNGSCWFVESLLRLGPQTAPIILTTDGKLGVITNQFGFTVTGESNLTLVMEGSTNLLDWLPLQTNTLTSGSSFFSDPDWSRSAQRFYRARLWP